MRKSQVQIAGAGTGKTYGLAELICNSEIEYGNIEIDNSKLNIFFFNVGQAESILITNNNKTNKGKSIEEIM